MAPETANVVENVVAAPAVQPVVNQQLQNAAAENWETELTRDTVYRLARGLTTRVRKELRYELLRRLGLEKEQRRLRNVDHWGDCAPARIRELAQQLLDERRERIGVFIEANRRTMREFAWRITRNWTLAENAISRTCEELWTGKTNPEHFYRALKMNTRDEMLMRDRERARFESLDSPLREETPREKLLEELEVEPDQSDLASHRLEDQDPLEILVQLEDDSEFARLIDAAKKHPKWRYCKRKQWAQPLRKCAEMSLCVE